MRSLRAVAAITVKDLRVLSRDPMALFWVLVFPVVFALFFGSIMKVGPDAERAPIAVVVVEHAAERSTAAARAREQSLVEALREAGLAVSVMPQARARDAVRRGEAALFIDLPAPTEFAPVQLGVDPTASAEVAMASGMLRAVLLRGLADNPIALPPFETHEVSALSAGPKSGFDAVFPAMIAWGLLGCAAAFAVALVSERSSGTLLRLYAAPFGRASIVAGKALACAIACVGGSVILTALGVWLLDVSIGEPLKYGAALLAAAACFVGLTQLLGVLGKSEQSVAGAGWSVLIVLAMCGGAMVPRVLMPEWLLAVSDFSPVGWCIGALEGATFRGLSWAELSRPLLLLGSVGVAGFAAAAVVLRVRET